MSVRLRTDGSGWEAVAGWSWPSAVEARVANETRQARQCRNEGRAIGKTLVGTMK